MTTSTEERALKLLGDGFNPETVASSIGVSPSRISQLLSDPKFAEAVSKRRFENLSKHSERDERYDKMEDALLDRMEKVVPMMYKPMEVLRALTQINAVKRKGVSNPSSILEQKEVVSLVLPTAIIQQFSVKMDVNVHNQVIKVGDQDLVTIQSGGMNDLLDATRNAENSENSTLELEHRNVETSSFRSPETIGASQSEVLIRTARERTGT